MRVEVYISIGRTLLRRHGRYSNIVYCARIYYIYIGTYTVILLCSRSICRDVFIHFPNENVMDILHNIVRGVSPRVCVFVLVRAVYI
jgi:hypothetical protein